ncbi:MAG TPA: EpsI family protein [Methylomirabilota bacterium]|nr:EpsI family protein [Methylomirabilota bacterium]
MRHAWRLGMVLALLVAAAGLIHLVPPVTEAVSPGVLDGIGSTLAGWTATETVPEPVLPRDPHEIAAVRRAYRNGSRIAWISVGMFTRQDDSLRRPSINHLYAVDHGALVERVDLRVALDGSSPTRLPALVIHRGDQRVGVVYWHQIGHRPYASEYGFRLALMQRILVARRGESALVRIAVPVRRTDELPRAFEAVAELGPPLYAAVSDALTR